MDKNLILEAQKLRRDGYSFGEIGAKMKLTKSQACYLTKLDPNEEKKESSHKKHEEKICTLAQKCNSINEICRYLGYHGTNTQYKKILDILIKNGVDTSHFNKKKEEKKIRKIKDEDVFKKDSNYNTSKLKQRLLKSNIKEYRCEICGNVLWCGKPIPLQVHHINGIRTDNRVENLQLICPNCHAFTDNYCGKNIKKEKRINKCEVCGKEISINAHKCANCYRENRKDAPNSEELLNILKETGTIESIVKQYHTSRKTVKKWLEKYGLPSSSLNIRKYITEKYGKINYKYLAKSTNVLIEYSNRRFKKKCLLDDKGEIEKIYNNTQEIIDDGFNPHKVTEVCNNHLKTHKKRKFKFLE